MIRLVSVQSIFPSACNWIASGRDSQPAITRPTAGQDRPWVILTYAQLRRLVNDTATVIRQSIGKESRIGLLIDPRVDNDSLAGTMVAFLSFLSRHVVAPLAPSLPLSQYRHLLQEMRIDTIVMAAASKEDRLRRAATLEGISIIPICAQGLDISRFDPPGDAGGDKNGLLLRTSGTTAQPKTVFLPTSALTENARRIADGLHLDADDYCCNPMPLFHVHGLIAGLLAPLISGGGVDLAPVGFALLRNLRNSGATWISAAPAIYQSILLRAKNGFGRPPCPRLRFLRSSSAPMPVYLHRQIEDFFQRPLLQAYGMSEASHQIASNRIEDNRPGSVGKPIGCRVRIEIAKNEPERSAPIQGEIASRVRIETAKNEPKRSAPIQGEIAICGPCVIQSYEDGDCRHSFSGKWLKTGDLGFFDSDGFLHLTGRAKELIIRAGKNIHPGPIEDAIMAHHDVAEAACFGIFDPIRGEDIAAVIVPATKTPPSIDAIWRFLRSRIASYQMPRHIFFQNALPRNAGGKIQRHRLRRKYEKRTPHENQGAGHP